MATETLKELKYNGKKIIVEVAKRDGQGRLIEDTYLDKSYLNVLQPLENAKGSVQKVTDLPTEGNTINDVYTIYTTGERFIWTKENTWKTLGGGIKEFDVPTKISELENDNQYITIGDVAPEIIKHNSATDSHSDIRTMISNITSRINSIANSSEEDLDTLAEIVSFIKNNRETLDAIGTNKINYDDIVDNLTTAITNKPLSANQGTVLKSLIDELNQISHAHSNKTILDGTTSSYTIEKDTLLNLNYSNLASLSENVDVMKSDISNAKNELAVKKVIGKDINSIIEQGYYELSDAINSPIANMTSGFLEVKELSDRFVQVWTVDGAEAFRLAEASIGILSNTFTAIAKSGSPEMTNEGNEYYLTAGGTYVLSGHLNGHIKIILPDGDIEAEEYTTLILNNLSVDSDISKAIDYPITNKGISIVVKENSFNYISCMLNTDSETLLDDAAIYSENNIRTYGSGYLSIRTNYGNHAIKANDIVINGKNHIYIEAIHDGLHGSKLVRVEYGYLFFYKAKDAIGTGDEGNIDIVGGTINIKNCLENGFDAKGKGTIQGYDTHIRFTNCGEGLLSTNFTVLESVDCPKCPITKTSYANFYGEGHVYLATEDASDFGYVKGEELPLTEDGYLFDSIPSGGILLVEGYVPHRIDIAEKSISVDVILNNAYITSSDDFPTIYYEAGSKKLAIKCLEGTINYVMQTAEIENGADFDYDSIKSEKNITLQGDGILTSIAKLGDGVDGSKVIIKGDGSKYLINNGRCGLKGSDIYIGEDPDKITSGEAKNYLGSLYAYDNNVENPEYADIYARNGSLTKGSIEENIYFKGDVYAPYIKSYSDANFLSYRIYSSNPDLNVIGTTKYEESINYSIAFPSAPLTLSGEWSIHNKDDVSKLNEKISIHESSSTAHSDIRTLISDLNERVSGIANSDDVSLDTLSEIVEYIKNNRSLLDSVGSTKVSITDIVDNLTTAITNKPLSANQGTVLKSLIDALTVKVDLNVADRHSHTNKTVLDNTTESFTTELKETINNNKNSIDEICSIIESIADSYEGI